MFPLFDIIPFFLKVPKTCGEKIISVVVTLKESYYHFSYFYTEARFENINFWESCGIRYPIMSNISEITFYVQGTCLTCLKVDISENGSMSNNIFRERRLKNLALMEAHRERL